MKPSQKTVKCIDWCQIIFDLEKAGLSLSEIAIGCGYRGKIGPGADDGGKAWAFRLKTIPDTQPDFHQGALLVGLWAETMARPLADLPRAEYRYVRNAFGRITALPLIDRPLDAGPQQVVRTEVEP